jgi:two-component system cell cycle response regulator
VVKQVRSNPQFSSTPILAIASENDQTARLAALSAGINDVLIHPINDHLMQARIRSLLRDQGQVDALRPPEQRAIGLAEPVADFSTPAHVALVTATPARASHWRMRLSEHLPHRITTSQFTDISNVMNAKPDAVVVEISDDKGPRLTADLCARGKLRDMAILGVATTEDPYLVADALDRGAQDVMQGDFRPEELALRLTSQLRKKASAAQLRATMKQDLKAALVDPLTGLYNRRYAVPQLAQLAREAELQQTCYAIMLADLDHFKQINDAYGHVAGDTILTETAKRLREPLSGSDLVARIGGEEFLIAVPHMPKALALSMANAVRNQINARPFRVDASPKPIDLTISIGLLCGPIPGLKQCSSDDEIARYLIDRADRALYAAKGHGRNRVSLVRDAA